MADIGIDADDLTIEIDIVSTARRLKAASVATPRAEHPRSTGELNLAHRELPSETRCGPHNICVVADNNARAHGTVAQRKRPSKFFMLDTGHP